MKCSQSFTLTHSRLIFLGVGRSRAWEIIKIQCWHLLELSSAHHILFAAQPCIYPRINFHRRCIFSQKFDPPLSQIGRHTARVQKLLFHFGLVLVRPLDIWIFFQPLLLRLGRAGWDCEETCCPQESITAGAEEDFSLSIFIHYLPWLPPPYIESTLALFQLNLIVEHNTGSKLGLEDWQALSQVRTGKKSD